VRKCGDVVARVVTCCSGDGRCRWKVGGFWQWWSSDGHCEVVFSSKVSLGGVFFISECSFRKIPGIYFPEVFIGLNF